MKRSTLNACLLNLMLTFVLTLLCASVALAQVKLEGAPEPKFTDAKLQTLSAGSGFSATVDNLVQQHQQPAWIGYAVPTFGKPRLICCSGTELRSRNGCCSSCRLESRNNNYNFDSTGGNCVNNEPPTHVFILIRIEGGQVKKVRPFTPDCELDADGLNVIWLRDVKPAESVAWLERYAANEGQSYKDNVVQSIALHADPAAEKALERFIQPGQNRHMRDQAGFWIAQLRGHAGFLILQKLARNDEDSKFREQLTFDFTQSDDPEATSELLHMAKQDSNSHVRGQAIFWLSQKAGKIAADAISDAMENDPDTSVKKQAVFALSQLPKDEGVPLLIKYARTHPNAAVRKDAIFWLGQSGDPRALDFLEELITGEKHSSR